MKMFEPVFGYVAPRGKCSKSDFHGGYHRLAWYTTGYDSDGLNGYSVRRHCVNCVKFYGKEAFKPSKRFELADKQLEG